MGNIEKRMKSFLEQITALAEKNPAQTTEEEYARFRENMLKAALAA